MTIIFRFICFSVFFYSALGQINTRFERLVKLKENVKLNFKIENIVRCNHFTTKCLNPHYGKTDFQFTKPFDVYEPIFVRDYIHKISKTVNIRDDQISITGRKDFIRYRRMRSKFPEKYAWSNSIVTITNLSFSDFGAFRCCNLTEACETFIVNVISENAQCLFLSDRVECELFYSGKSPLIIKRNRKTINSKQNVKENCINKTNLSFDKRGFRRDGKLKISSSTCPFFVHLKFV